MKKRKRNKEVAVIPAVGFAFNLPQPPITFERLLALGQVTGSSLFTLGATWHELQPYEGDVDIQRLVLDPLAAIDAAHPEITHVTLTIKMVDGARTSLPSDLPGSQDWSSGWVRAAMRRLIDALTLEPLVRKHIKTILLGNEIDGGLATPEAEESFIDFYADTARHIHRRLPDVQVGTVMTAAGATVGRRALFDQINVHSDVIAYTFYPVQGITNSTPIEGTWQAEPVYMLPYFLGELIGRAGGKPVGFTEIAYPSSLANGSSLWQQAYAIQAIFESLRPVRDRVSFISMHALHDYDPALAMQFPENVRSFVQSLGLRSWETGDGKPAWDAYGAALREWGEG